jgi:DNA-binding response OmpR family regulator
MRPVYSSDSLPEHLALQSKAGANVPRTVLVVDDDPQMLQTLVCYFEHRNYQVVTATTIAEARSAFRRVQNLLFVLSDFHLPDGTGADLRAWVIEQSDPPTPFLLMSGSTQGAGLIEDFDFLAKPFSIDALEERVNALLNGRRV